MKFGMLTSSMRMLNYAKSLKSTLVNDAEEILEQLIQYRIIFKYHFIIIYWNRVDN